MSAMHMPGFTAEATLSTSAAPYRSSGSWGQTLGALHPAAVFGIGGGIIGGGFAFLPGGGVVLHHGTTTCTCWPFQPCQCIDTGQQ